jgi:outer membrane lipoprotein-sorting protein
MKHHENGEFMRSVLLALALIASVASGCGHSSSHGYGHVVTLYADNGEPIKTWQANGLYYSNSRASFVEYGSTRRTSTYGTYTVVDVR